MVIFHNKTLLYPNPRYNEDDTVHLKYDHTSVE